MVALIVSVTVFFNLHAQCAKIDFESSFKQSYSAKAELLKNYAFADSTKSPIDQKINPAVDSSKADLTKNKRFVMQKSSTKAVVYSLIFPGLGQIYTESYWKAPLFIAGAGTLYFMFFWNNARYIEKSDIVDKISDKNSTEYQYQRSWREYYRDNRDMSAFFLLGVYVLSAVDAYSDAHLFDFDVGEKFSMNLKPDTYRGLVVCLSISR